MIAQPLKLVVPVNVAVHVTLISCVVILTIPVRVVFRSNSKSSSAPELRIAFTKLADHTTTLSSKYHGVVSVALILTSSSVAPPHVTGTRLTPSYDRISPGTGGVVVKSTSLSPQRVATQLNQVLLNIVNAF